MPSSSNQPTSDDAIRASRQTSHDLIATYLESLNPYYDLTFCTPKPWSLYRSDLHTIADRAPSVRNHPLETSL